jgi:hypothetical protein
VRDVAVATEATRNMNMKITPTIAKRKLDSAIVKNSKKKTDWITFFRFPGKSGGHLVDRG